MDTVVMLLMFLLAYICIYSFVDRICKCIENCNFSKNVSTHADELLEKLKRKFNGVSDAEEK